MLDIVWQSRTVFGYHFVMLFQYGSKNRENLKRASVYQNALDTFLMLFFYYFVERY